MTAPALPLTGISAVGAPRAMPLLEQRIINRRRHHARSGAVDAAIIVAAVGATTALELTRQTVSAAAAGHLVFGALVLALAWTTALHVLRREAHRRGAGERLELLPILHSAAIGVAGLAILAGVTGWPVLAAHVALTLPAGIAILVTSRLVQHAWTARPASHATLDSRTLIVGSRSGITHTVQSLRGARSGHDIVGVVVVDGDAGPLTVDGVAFDVMSGAVDVAQIARDRCIETVVVAGGAGDDPDYVRRLSWSLEGAATDLVLATRLADVAQSRIRFDRAQSLALIRVSLPRFDRPTMRAKRRLDVVVAALALIPIGLITPIIALAIVLDSPGGVFFRQRRIGRDGREFDILKFRTMGTDAEARRAELEAQNEGAGPLFKLKHDPRVTRVGAILRRFSLDELPQFWNVLTGEMSVVGPRPPLPDEVQGYDRDMLRRLYVQPGITGLWQISGRSDLSWEQSVRLDLHYVENWSVTADLKIMLLTAAVMVRPKGAY